MDGGCFSCCCFVLVSFDDRRLDATCAAKQCDSETWVTEYPLVRVTLVIADKERKSRRVSVGDGKRKTNKIRKVFLQLKKSAAIADAGNSKMDSNARRRPNNQTNQYHEDEVQVLTGPKTSTLGCISSFFRIS